MRLGCWLSRATISAARCGRHVGGGRVEPDDGGEVAVVGEEFFELRDGLGVEVGVEVAVLCLVPVVGGRLVVAGLVGGAAGGGPVLILRVVEAELDALLAALFG